MIEVGEIWKDIKGYEEKYQVSNYGRVKSKERYSDCCYGKQRLLKKKKYLSITRQKWIFKNNVIKRKK